MFWDFVYDTLFNMLYCFTWGIEELLLLFGAFFFHFRVLTSCRLYAECLTKTVRSFRLNSFCSRRMEIICTLEAERYNLGFYFFQSFYVKIVKNEVCYFNA